jgi:hypothetical protein
MESREDALYDLKAAFGRAGCGRLASLAVLAGQPHDDQEPGEHSAIGHSESRIERATQLPRCIHRQHHFQIAVLLQRQRYGDRPDTRPNDRERLVISVDVLESHGRHVLHARDRTRSIAHG